MSKKQTSRSTVQRMRILTRRDALTLGAAAATTFYLPGGLIRDASAQSASFNYYIGPNGSDSNPGTLSQPWAITALNTRRSTYAGKVVGLLDGTYDLIAIMGQPTSTYESGSLGIAGGSASSPTVVKAVNPRQAIIDWNRAAQSNSSSGASFQPYGDYVTIDGLAIINNNYRSICNYTNGGSHFTVRNCLFRGQSFVQGGQNANSCTIYSQGHDDILIQNCRFEGGSAPVDNGRHAVIQTYQATNGVTVEYCSFIGQSNPNTGNMIHFKQGENKNLVVRNCYFEHPTGNQFLYIQGSVSDSSATYDFYNNVFNRTASSSGAGMMYIDSPGWNGIVSIYNNTYVGPTGGGALPHLWRGSPQQVNYFNNILIRPTTPGSYGDLDLPGLSQLGVFDYNVYDSNPTTVFHYNSGGSSASGLNAWRLASGKDALSIEISDPLFVRSGTDAAYFRLQASSLAKALGGGGLEVGAWGGVSQVGCSFGGGVVLAVPDAPQITSVV